jgi:hypothetical protein
MLFIEHSFAPVRPVLFVHGAVQTWHSPGVWSYACMDVRVCDIGCVCADECQQRVVDCVVGQTDGWSAIGLFMSTNDRWNTSHPIVCMWFRNSSTIIAYFHSSLGATISLAIVQASVMCLCNVRGCDLQETAAMHCCGARVDLAHFSHDIWDNMPMSCLW